MNLIRHSSPDGRARRAMRQYKWTGFRRPTTWLTTVMVLRYYPTTDRIFTSRFRESSP